MSSTAAAVRPAGPTTRPGLVLAVTCAAQFMGVLDVTIVNIAFPSIEATFDGASRADLSWVLNAYNIVFAALLVPAGRLADLVGRLWRALPAGRREPAPPRLVARAADPDAAASATPILTVENLDQALARSEEPGGHNVGEDGAKVAVEMATLVTRVRTG